MNKNYYLYIALLIPIILVVVTAAGMLFPQNELLPEENFVYLVAEHYGAFHCGQDLKQKLFADSLNHHVPPLSSDQMNSCASAGLYLYNFKEKSNTKLTLAEAKELLASDKTESPDGFRLEEYCSSGMYSMWPFEMSSNHHYNVCIQKDTYQKKINISPDSKYNSFQFIGWTKKTATIAKEQ